MSGPRVRQGMRTRPGGAAVDCNRATGSASRENRSGGEPGASATGGASRERERPEGRAGSVSDRRQQLRSLTLPARQHERASKRAVRHGAGGGASPSGGGAGAG